MPSSQPSKLTLTGQKWEQVGDKLINNINYLFSDIYTWIDTIRGIDNKTFEPEVISLPSGLTAKFANTGLQIYDTDGSNLLTITTNSDLTADRTLTFTTGDASRTITLNGNPTLNDWFDQSVKQASSPIFSTVKLSGLTDGYLPYHTSDAVGLANSILFTDGTNLGIGTAVPDVLLHVKKDNATAVLRLERNQAIITSSDVLGRIEVETQDTDDPGICAKIEALSYGTAGETGWRISTGTPSALAEAVQIDPDGNVGIGTPWPDSPDAQLHIQDIAGAVQRMTRKDTIVTATDIIGRIEFETQDTDSHGIAAYIQAIAEGTLGEVGVSIATGTPASLAERVRISNAGIFSVFGLPAHANNAAAIAGGLSAGAFYRTNADPDPVCVVH